MPGKRSAKPRIAVVGAGNLAGALAPALHHSGYVIEQIVARERGGPAALRRARRLAREVGASVAARVKANARSVSISADVVWFCVPDRAIAGAARSLEAAADWQGKVALHSSGALTSDELSVMRKRGAAVASVHPMMTFVRASRPALAGVPFAIEGDRRAVRAARDIVRDLGGRPFGIGKQQKEIYHAWGMFASPLLTALLAAGEHVAGAAGVSRTAARARMLPILRQTLENYGRLGASGAFSGPIERGDVETVRRHLKVLRKILGARDVYVALATAAVRDLPVKKRSALAKVLAG